MTVAVTDEPARLASVARLGELDDRRLVVRATDGDRAAFEQLVHRYTDRLKCNIATIVTGADRDDVLQRTWLKIYRKLDTLRDPDHFYAWANRIAVNFALGLVRKRGRRRNSDIDDLPRSKQPVDDGVDAEQRARWRDLLDQTRDWFEQLEPRDQRLFRYAIVDGMTMAEIADRVDMSEGGVKTRLYRARQYLRAQRQAVS